MGSSFLLPFLGLAQEPELQDQTDDAEYEILLKPGRLNPEEGGPRCGVSSAESPPARR